MDIAGLNDTSGPFIDLITTFFLHRLLYEKLNLIKLIVPIPINNLSEQRGQHIR